MRVLVTSYFYEFRFGGAELVARTIKRNLEQQRGLMVDVLCLAGSTTPEPHGNIHRLPVPPWWWRNPQLFKRIVLFLNNRFFDRWVIERALKLRLDGANYDLIHCQDFNALGASYALATRFGKPLIFTLHDSIPKRMHPGQAGPALTRLLDRSLTWRAHQLLPALRATHEVICVSEFIRASLTRFVNCSSTVIYPPGEEYLTRLPPQQSRGGDRRKLLFIGRLSREKGIDLLIEALRKVPPDVSLSILGLDGPLRAQVESAASPRIQLLPPVPHSEIQKIIAEHDVVCCPSMFEEPFGKTVFETRLSSKPILATTLGGIPEITAGYPRAVLVDPRGKSETEIIQAIAHGIEQALGLATAPLDATKEESFLKRFSLDHALDAHLAVYQRLGASLLR